MGKNPKSPFNSQKKIKSEGSYLAVLKFILQGPKKMKGKELTIPYYQGILIVNKEKIFFEPL